MNTAFTIYWKSGVKSTIVGEDFDSAYHNAGFTATARKDVDMYRYGVDNTYSWNDQTKLWVKKG